MTLDEQRDWVETQLDAGVAATGISEGWYWHPTSRIPWLDNGAEREQIKRSWLPRDCSGSGARLTQNVNITRDEGGVENPAEVGVKVRAFWESQGWTVIDLYPDASAENPKFRIEGEDGAQMGFQASRDGVSFSVASACSVNSSVTNWGLHEEIAAERDASHVTKEEVVAAFDAASVRAAGAFGQTDPILPPVSAAKCETLEGLTGVNYSREVTVVRPDEPTDEALARIREAFSEDVYLHRAGVTDGGDGAGRSVSMTPIVGYSMPIEHVTVSVLEDDLTANIVVSSVCVVASDPG
ncbi:MAG: hypothetical protein P0Y60_03145 [Candidatus Microbacterium colombiense]|nr:MAG: hypothetical protein P0Y60_03145 [Microbacterium sp.]